MSGQIDLSRYITFVSSQTIRMGFGVEKILVIRHERKASLYESWARRSVRYRRAVTVLGDRPRANVPELGKVLGREA